MLTTNGRNLPAVWKVGVRVTEALSKMTKGERLRCLLLVARAYRRKLQKLGMLS